MSFVWAIAFGRDVGDSKKPSTLSARYLSSWLAFLGLIFTNVYVAELMVEVVKRDVLLYFNSLKDPKVNIIQNHVLTSASLRQLLPQRGTILHFALLSDYAWTGGTSALS